MYLQTLLKRPEDEITRKVYECQKVYPLKGDWVELLKKDFSNLEIAMDEDLIKSESKTVYKHRVKKHMKTYMLKELKNQQQGHNKINQICYNSLETQKYLKTHRLNNHEVFFVVLP